MIKIDGLRVEMSYDGDKVFEKIFILIGNFELHIRSLNIVNDFEDMYFDINNKIMDNEEMDTIEDENDFGDIVSDMDELKIRIYNDAYRFGIMLSECRAEEIVYYLNKNKDDFEMNKRSNPHDTNKHKVVYLDKEEKLKEVFVKYDSYAYQLARVKFEKIPMEKENKIFKFKIIDY